MTMECLPPLDPLDSVDSNNHPLLDPKPRTYSHTTVQRAFIVWLRCGQQNHFKNVCDYYHRLEAMEDQMSANRRAASRNYEFSLFTNHPPTSSYLQRNFPNLYSLPHAEHQGYPIDYLQNYPTVVEEKETVVLIKEIKEEKEGVKDKKEQIARKKPTDAKKAALSDKEIFESSQLFRSDCKFEEVKQKNNIGLAFAKLGIDDGKSNDVMKPEDKDKKEGNESTGTPKKDIVETSQLIKNYCTDHQVPLNNFLENFKEHASRCELTNTVTNVGFYIKRKMVQAELGLAVKVHRAKVYNNGNKENRFKITTSPPNIVKPTKLYDTLNIDNEALVNGFAKVSMQITKSNVTDKPKVEVSTAKVFGVKDKNIDKKITLLKRDDNDLTKNGTGYSNTRLAKIDTVVWRRV